MFLKVYVKNFVYKQSSYNFPRIIELLEIVAIEHSRYM